MLREKILNIFARLRAARQKNPALFWRSALYASFWISVAFFPIGYGFREVAPVVSFIFLILYYRHGWQNSTLRRLKPKWLFLCFYSMAAIGVVFSINPWQSLLHAGTGINKAFILPFIAMECARDEKDLKNLAWAFAFACFWEGLDGVWQAATGRDFIMNYPLNDNRLTGSLGDYTVGNYMALAMIPAFGVWFILRERLGLFSSLFIFAAIFWPAVFTLQGASARSGILSIAGALFIWEIIRYKSLSWKIMAAPAIIFIIFSAFQPGRLSYNSIASNSRWDLWNLAWKVFLEHPYFGAGAGQYNSAFRELGLSPASEVITISHPHNLYLDMLYAHGMAGFALGMIFLAGFAFWGLKNIIPMLEKETGSRSASCYWRLSAWMFLAYAGWLINGVFGHDFYRIWWLSMAMISLGIMCGAIVNGKQPLAKPLQINEKKT